MLISTSNVDKSNSKYQCDMCKKLISPLNRIVISKGNSYENPKKRWDLCLKCFSKLERAVERWHLKNK